MVVVIHMPARPFELQEGPAIKFHLASIGPFDRVLRKQNASAGQLCIVETIKRYRAVYLALIMTLRQFISISASSWIFGHHLSPAQW